MTVLVTGAAGHLGGNFVRALLDQGRSVRVLVRHDTRALDGLDLDRVRGDVLDRASLKKAVRGVDTVFHLAAHIAIVPGEEDLLRAINVEGPRNVAQACMAEGVKRLVHCSSCHAFCSDPCDAVIDETRGPADSGRHCEPYDGSKAIGERQVLAAVEKGLDAVIVNPTSILGPHDYKLSRMGAVLLALFRQRLPALVEGAYDWVDARDVVKGLIAAEKLGRTGERYLLTGHRTTVRELALIAEEVSGRKVPRLTAPLWLAAAASPFGEAFARVSGTQPLLTAMALRTLAANSFFSRDKAARELGYEPRPLRETVADTYAWFREAGMLNGTSRRLFLY